MDDVVPSLPALVPSLVPAGGLVGLAVWWLVIVMRQASRDRSGYQAVLDAARESHAAELVRLRKELAEAHAELARQRRLTWEAEDAAAKWRRAAQVGPDG